MTAATIEGVSPSLVSSCILNQRDMAKQFRDLNQRDTAKQLLTPLPLIARMNFSLKNYTCGLLNLTGTVGKVELISIAKAGM